MQAFCLSAINAKPRNKRFLGNRPKASRRWKATDWKCVLTSLLATAVPFYFWQPDITAHSLSVRLIYSSVLELPTDSKVHNLQISFNGSKIEAPHIYSLALVNTGSKPILSIDFETPIEIHTKNTSKLVTAPITGSEPADIPAKRVLEGSPVAGALIPELNIRGGMT